MLVLPTQERAHDAEATDAGWASDATWEHVRSILLGMEFKERDSTRPAALFNREVCADLMEAACTAEHWQAALKLLLRLLAENQTAGIARSEALGTIRELAVGSEIALVDGNPPRLAACAGTARKSMSVFYTPQSLVDEMVSSAFEPIFQKFQQEYPDPSAHATSLLNLRICDPACGGAKLLIGAARYLARELARVRHGATCASDAQLNLALCDVVETCVYGVDRDPVAIDICHHALALECNRRVRTNLVCADSLIGAPPRRSTQMSTEAPDIQTANYNAWVAASALGRTDHASAGYESVSHIHVADLKPMHWPIVFENVFARGGFDVIISNPPWAVLQPLEARFFAARGRQDIAKLSSQARKAAINELSGSLLHRQWYREHALSSARSRFARESGRYPLSGRGRVNSYSLFVETILELLHPEGEASCLAPSGLVTDEGTARLFRHLSESGSIRRLLHFDNRGSLFDGVGGNVTFCLLNLSRKARRDSQIPFATYLRHPDQARLPQRQVKIATSELQLFNANTGALPMFRCQRDAKIARKAHERFPPLVRDGGKNPWNLRLRQGLFNMTSDAMHFHSRAQLDAAGAAWEGLSCRVGATRFSPVYEAKMIHQFDHLWMSRPRASRDQHSPNNRSPSAGTRYWVQEDLVDTRLRQTHNWLLGWRLVCSGTDSRSIIGTVLPRVGCGNSILVLDPQIDASCVPLFVAVLNSYIVDFLARHKLGGTNLNFHILKQLPIPEPAHAFEPAPWDHTVTTGKWLSQRVAPLVYTTPELAPFARDLGCAREPYPWDTERRQHLRAEIDAALFHIYGIQRSDVEHIMDSFDVLRRDEEKRMGSYATKIRVLEAFESLSLQASG